MPKLFIQERGGRRQGLFITQVPKVLWWRFLICWYQNIGDFYWMIGWFIKVSVHSFQPTVVIYRWGNFVYHNWGCTSNYRPLSYPFILLLWISRLMLLLLLTLGVDWLGSEITNQDRQCYNGCQVSAAFLCY